MIDRGAWSLKIKNPNVLRMKMAALAKPLPRNEHGRRNKEDEERWVLASWIRAGGLADYWNEYPFVLSHPDKPDFILDSGTRSLGIEVAEITGKAAAQAQVLASKKALNEYFLIGPYDHNREMKEQELFAVMEKGDMWQGAEPAEAFLDLTSSLLRQKIERSKGYQAVSRLVLLLYDDSTLPFSWENFQDKPVLTRLQAVVKGAKPFDAISILSDGVCRSYAT